MLVASTGTLDICGRIQTQPFEFISTCTVILNEICSLELLWSTNPDTTPKAQSVVHMLTLLYRLTLWPTIVVQMLSHYALTHQSTSRTSTLVYIFTP